MRKSLKIKSKLLIVSQHFWPENFIINKIAIDIQRVGYSVDILTGKPCYPVERIFKGFDFFGSKKFFHNNLHIFRVPLILRKSKSSLNIILNYISFCFSAYFFSFCLLKKKSYDLVFVFATSPIIQAIPAILIAKKKKAPIVLWVQDLWPESPVATGFLKNKILIFILKKIVCYIYKNVDLILVPSKAFIKPISLLAPNKKILYYPNPSFENHELRYKFSLIDKFNDKFKVLFAGNIGKAQSIDSIVRAAQLLEKYKNIHFLIVGAGSEFSNVRALISKLKLKNISLTGYVEPKYMPHLFENSSVLLVSLIDSPIFSLTIPSKFQMYLGAGKPIIASINGETARIVRESNSGLAVKPENPYLLSKAILKISKMTNHQRYLLGQNAKKYAYENYDQKKLISKLHHIFQEQIVV
jgi:glycosyltransferase involved in cell wall biosynthesis